MMVVPLIDGTELWEFLDKSDFELEPPIAFILIKQVWEKLKDIFSKGYLFRDLKLENIMIERGRPYGSCLRIIDAGWAMLISSVPNSGLAGTYDYIPDQLLFNNAQQNVASDIYALYRMLILMCGFLETNDRGGYIFENVKTTDVQYTRPKAMKKLTADYESDINSQIIFELAQRLGDYPANEKKLNSCGIESLIESINELFQRAGACLEKGIPLSETFEECRAAARTAPPIEKSTYNTSFRN